MPEPYELQIGDPCQNCGAPLERLPAPTDAMRAAAANRDNPVPVNSLKYDTAPQSVIDDLGDLYECTRRCGFHHRLKAPAPAGKTRGAKASPAGA